MNFEKLKNEMNDSANNERRNIELDLSKGKNNPVHKLKRNMRAEIVTQLLFIVIIMTYPLYKEMETRPRALYYIFMFIASLMTAGYALRLSSFLKKTSGFALNTKDAIKDFIYESKLTLEVFKSFVIAGSLIIPIPIFIMINGRKEGGNMELFHKYFNLDLNASELLLLITGYIAIAVVIYLITLFYTKKLYVKYVNELEEISNQLDD